MRDLSGWIPTVILCLAASAAPPLAAQTGTLTGTVRDAETGAPVEDAAVEVLGAEGAQAGGVFTNAQGRYSVTVAAGTYSVVASMIGRETVRTDGVRIEAGGTRTLDFELSTTAFLLNPFVVTASRREEKALDAPASISIVGRERIRSEPGFTPVEHVKGLKGVDIARTGLNSSNVVTRGFNNVFSGSLLVLTDNRYAHVPSLRFNAHNMIPLTSEDVERIEVVLGPGAALYGPNSASGVLHVITTSPIEDPGTSVSVSSGLRSRNGVEEKFGLDTGGVLQAQFRHATRFSDEVGLKVSGQWFQGDDWAFVDPAERSAAAQPGANPLIGHRRDLAERWGGEARLDWRPWNDGEVIFNAGVNRLAKSVELTGLGAGQAEDWTYSFLQSRVRKGRFFAQAFVNASDAGDTYLLRTGQPIVDESRMLVSQLQHGFDVGERQSFTYGLDLQRTEPRTQGTITGSNEDDDNINEVGGYIHSETSLTERLDLVGALRVDWHSRLPDVNVSPRVALAFRPQENQTFRATFNRAFSTPTTNNLFLDIRAGNIPIPPDDPAFGYDIRTLGVPEAGFTFDAECPGGVQALCMYSPLRPGQQLPANAAVLWNGLVQQFVPPSLQQFLTDPAQGDLATVLKSFDQVAAQSGQFPWPRETGAPEPIAPITSTITNTLELGYKGLVGDRLLLSADVYRSDVEDFVGPLRVETPHVFLGAPEAIAFIERRLQPLVAADQMSAEEAAATAQQIGGQFARIPLGTVVPDQRSDSDVVLTYRNFGDVSFYGLDLGAELIATDRLTLRGSFSYVSEECFDFNDDGDCTSAVDISLNAPTAKGSLGARWENAALGLSVGGQARLTGGFIMNSGVYVGEVEGYAVFDANVGYNVSRVPGMSATVSVNNVFNELHREFVGAPELGRLGMLRLRYEL